MPKRIVRQTVVLYREGKQVRPELNKVFDFTVDELEDLKSVPGAVDKLVKTDGSTETPEEEAKREAEEAQRQADEKKAADAKKAAEAEAAKKAAEAEAAKKAGNKGTGNKNDDL